MCELMEQYLKEAREEGKQKGEQEARQKIIQAMIRYGFDKDKILDLDVTEDEYNKAEQALLVHS